MTISSLVNYLLLEQVKRVLYNWLIAEIPVITQCVCYSTSSSIRKRKICEFNASNRVVSTVMAQRRLAQVAYEISVTAMYSTFRFAVSCSMLIYCLFKKATCDVIITIVSCSTTASYRRVLHLKSVDVIWIYYNTMHESFKVRTNVWYSTILTRIPTSRTYCQKIISYSIAWSTGGCLFWTFSKWPCICFNLLQI